MGKHAIQNVESDVEANVASDHYPLWWTACIKFRRKAKNEDLVNKRIKLKPCTEELKLTINSLLFEINDKDLNKEEWCEECKD